MGEFLLRLYPARARQQPKQGSKRPWKLYQNYALDLLSLRFGSVRDRAMVFSGQVNDRVTVPNGPKSAT